MLRYRVDHQSDFAKADMSSIRYEIREKCKFKDIDDVIPMQPEVPFSTTTVKNLK